MRNDRASLESSPSREASILKRSTPDRVTIIASFSGSSTIATVGNIVDLVARSNEIVESIVSRMSMYKNGGGVWTATRMTDGENRT